MSGQWMHSVACHTLFSISIRRHSGPNMTLFCPFFSTPSWWDRVLGHRRASVTLWISSASEHFGVKHHVLGMRPFSEASDQPRGQKRFLFIPQNIGFATSMLRIPKLLPKLEFHFLKASLTSYSPSNLLLTFRSIQDFWNGSKWFPIPQNIGFDTRTMYLACSEAVLLPKLEFHFLKSFLTSYSPSTPFLA